MKLRRARASRKGRIEIIPMIDVMFFLLATFMLASLTMQNLHSLPVNLPLGRADPLQVRKPLTLTITRDGTLQINETAVELDDIGRVLTPLLAEADHKLVVNADTEAPNGRVVQAMLKARQAGATQLMIAVKRE